MSAGRLIQRTAASLVILIGVSVLVFSAVRLVPGDPVSIMLGKADQANAPMVAEFRRSYGLDDPLPVQYVAWFGHALSGDFGRSLDTHEPVGDILGRRLSATLLLASLAALLAVSGGIAWGVAGAYLGGLAGRVLRSSPLVLLSVPPFSLGIGLAFVFAVWLRMLPSSGMESPVDGGGALDLLRHAVLPAVTLAVGPAAFTARLTAGALDELRHEDFVRTARASGIPPRRIAIRHILPNALLPVITNAGVLVGSMFTSAVFVEAVFGWPGVGTMMISAVQGRDYPTVQAGAFIVAAVFVLVSWIVDTLYGVVDPRIKTSGAVRG